jgi:hypothetical protein
MNENNIQKEDEILQEDGILRTMMQDAKAEAPENLKYRIMQQIESEKALTTQKTKPKKGSDNVLKELGAIFGTMYAVLAGIAVGAYLLYGENFLFSPQFWGTVAMVAFIFSLLWLISRLDANLRERKK